MHDFTVLVLSGAYPSSVALTLDVLATAHALAPTIGVPMPSWRVCTTSDAPDKTLKLGNGLSLEAAVLPRRKQRDSSIWVVPGLGMNSPDAAHKRLEAADAKQAINALKSHAQSGGRVAASCSAAFLLQAAGLLKHRKATISWWLAPELAKLEPDCKLDATRMVCADGPVVTAGAALAQTELMLYLLRMSFGAKLTEALTRFMLLSERQAQAPFVVPEVLASGDELVAKLTHRVEVALPSIPSISELASEFCISQRTLSRHVEAATGNTTLALIQSIRLRRARVLLQSSRMTVEQIAAQVGYQDATALRRLMHKTTRANPSQFRSRGMA